MLETGLCLALARFLIACLPFRWWCATLGPLDGAPPPLSAVQLKRAVDIGRSVGWLADRMPFSAVCLPQAMAARWMLARRGIASRISIGARRGERIEEAMQVHAWLRAGDRVVTGRHEHGAYAALAAGEAGTR